VKAIQLLGGALVILLISVPAFSQGSAGRILGTVIDQSGGVVAGATVTVIDTARGVTRTLTSDDAGEYNAPNLTPSTYTVRVEAKGFKKLERQNAVLQVGQEIRIDVTLQPGAQEQTVTVTESVPLVETTNATLGGTLDNAEIADLPLNGRNYQDLLGLRPGVVLQPGGGPWTQSTNNVRPDESVWMLDGVINANMYDTRPIANMPSPFTDGATILPIDAIQEFNLMENPKAEYGWKPGAVVNVGVKSGTNTLHGTAYGFYRSAAWDARNFFNPDVNSRPSCINDHTVPCSLSPVQLRQFGGVVGGPIKKDKLFFLASYETQHNFIGNQIGTAGTPETIGSGTAPSSANCGAAVLAVNPTADCKVSMVDAINALATSGGGFNTSMLSPVSLALAGCTVGANAAATACTGGLFPTNTTGSTSYTSTWPNTNVSQNGLAKIDYHVNDKNSLNGLVMINNYDDTGEDHPFLNPVFENPNRVRTYTIGSDWVWTPTSRLVNDARFGYDKVNFIFLTNDGNRLADGTGLTGGAGYPINTGITAYGGLPNINLNSFEKLGSWHNRPQNWANWYGDFQDNISYLAGKHSWKFGGEFAHIDVINAVPDTVRGRIDFRGGSGACSVDAGLTKTTDLTDFFCGAPRRGFVLTGNPNRHETWQSYAAYAQDDWRMTQKVTLNLGVRYSYIAPIHEANNLWANFDPAKGLVQQGQAGVGSTLWKPDHKNFSPRVGFAYDVTGKGTTVVRGGFSLIYSSFTAVEFLNQNGFQNTTAMSVASNPTGALISDGVCSTVAPVTCPTVTPGGTITFASSKISSIPVATYNTPAGSPGIFSGGATPICSSGSRCNILAIDRNLLTPYVLNWSLGVQHSFGSNLSLEVGYVGTHGSRLTGFRDLNQPDLATGVRHFDSTLDAAGHAMSYLGFINQISNDARSNYHSLQTTLTKRMSHGVSFIAGYTYSHGFDNGSLNRTAYIPQDSSNPGAEYASSDFDVRHRFTFTTTYNIPGIKGYAQLLEGWKLNAIVNVQSAQPWVISDTSNNFSCGGCNAGDNADRWNITGNPANFHSGPNSITYCTGPNACTQTSGISGITFAAPDGWSKCTTADGALTTPLTSNLAGAGCFVAGNAVLTPNATGSFGNMGRNIFRDSGFKNVDFSVFKNFTYHERFSAEFRLEIFNLFNHPLSANPYGSANGWGNGNDPSLPNTFGCGCATADVAGGSPQLGSGAARGLQIGLKLGF
jgi:hypothetical protein